VSKFSRRSFLKRSLGFADNRQAVPDTALVCVFLRGGADTLNILVPYGDDDYYKARQTIAIGRPGTKYSEGGSALYGLDTNSDLLSVSGRSTLDLLLKVEKMRGGKGVLDLAHYPQSQLAGGLREVARLIKAQVGLRVACLELGGWDTHFVQGGAQGMQARAIAELFQGLAAFEQDLLACRQSYVVLVLTEFGRRVYENVSLGTDHGRGFAFMALGSKINGGKIYGHWPGLQEQESDYLLGPSGMRVLIDYRNVLSEILGNLCGVKESEGVFPGLKESAPLGLVAPD
jgi:uncharacterized protein (DUF1501 family)